MEMESTQVADSGAGAGAPDLQAVLDGTASVESVLEQATPQKAGTPEPAQTTEVKEPTTAEPVKTEPDQTTEQDDAEPLPQKIEDLLKQVRASNPTLAKDLNKIVREDHFLLHGPTGFLAAFPGGMEEASQYKATFPTTEDLQTGAEYSQRYEFVDGQYRTNPAMLLDTLARDPQSPDGIAPEFRRLAETFEPSVRQLNNPALYESAAKPFNVNFWNNVMATVQREGAPEEVELFKAFEAKYLGAMRQGAQAWNGQGQQQPHPAQSELERLRSEREEFGRQQQEAFFNDAKGSWTQTIDSEIRKHLEEKMGSAIPKDIRDDVLTEGVRQSAAAVWKFIDSNPMVVSRLAGIIDSGDRSPQHKKAVIDSVLAYAKPQIQIATAPVIRKQLARAKAYGGSTNATTTTTAPSRDVGSGSPSVGNPQGAPKGFPAGWNAMDPEARSKFINWRAMGEDADEIVLTAHQTGDWSKVVLKGK